MKALPTLPNGATILAIDYLAGVVLAVNEGLHDHEFITWEFYRGDLASTSTGYYYGVYLDEAREGYAERVTKSLTKNAYPVKG